MATRNLTEKFTVFRDKAKGYEGYMGSSDSNDDNIDIQQMNERKWLNIIAEIDKTLAKIPRAITDLEQAHTNRLKVSFDEEKDIENDQIINAKSDTVMSLFKTADQQIKSLAHISNRDDMIAQNCIKSKVMALKPFSERFKLIRQKYNESIKTTHQSHIIDLSHTPTASSNFYDQNQYSEQTQEHQQAMQIDENLLHARTDQIQQLAQDISLLTDMFKDLDTMVETQGTVLDRIDYNIENANIHADKGVAELKQAVEYKKGCKTTACVIILLVIMIILASLLGVRENRR